MRVFIVALAMAVSLPAFAQQAQRVSESALRKAMVDRLKDADSAKFKSIKSKIENGSNGVLLICGEVNAKNSYGAYAGYEPFMAIGLNKGRGEYLVIGIGEAAGMTCDKKF